MRQVLSMEILALLFLLAFTPGGDMVAAPDDYGNVILWSAAVRQAQKHEIRIESHVQGACGCAHVGKIGFAQHRRFAAFRIIPAIL